MIAPLETLTIEIDSDVLAQAEKVCADIGITLQDAVNMFLRETVIQQRWPMDTMGFGTSRDAGTETRLNSESPHLGPDFSHNRGLRPIS